MGPIFFACWDLQKALIQLDTWCKCNGMIINSAKTKVMLIATAQKRGKLSDDSLDLLFKDVTLQTIFYDKILGVYVDNNLTLSFHINFITKKISSYLWLLSRIKEYLSIENRVKFYKSYVRPHLDFCNIIWGNTSQKNLMKIYRLQKRACRILFKENSASSFLKSVNFHQIFMIWLKV